MKQLILIFTFGLLVHAASAIDYQATPESAWVKRFGSAPGFEVTDAALRTAIEWDLFGGPVPKINGATHYGLQLKRWERSIRQFGFAVIADDYATFLEGLKAELSRQKK
ncbi:MAG TPA: hypothetical protein VNQ90_17665 [Chthoniobacteraceae bacterium]|nr:hypothetical protein [Chthoniobacteraceae bacterium]